jgi:hypothetical protein
MRMRYYEALDDDVEPAPAPRAQVKPPPPHPLMCLFGRAL